MANLSVKPEYLKYLTDIFDKYCPEAEIFAYGSRINGRSHDGSDLDLTVKNLPKDKYLFELKEIISESNVPFLVDINLFETLPESFKSEIEKNNVKIYPIL